ncbi:MAG: hypothetical protein WC725_04930 [Patescibacteria group bacterium]|jgi:hypothetical protein
MNLKIKTLAGCNKPTYSEYLQPNDQVDEDMVDYFNEVLPPLKTRAGLIQCSEPYDHVNGKATFTTFEQIGKDWFYRGHCHHNETEHKIGIFELNTN